MGYRNQPASLPTEEGKDEHSITTKPNGAYNGGWNPGAYSFEADVMSVPFNSLGYDHFSGPDIQGDFRFYPTDLNCLPDSKTDGNLINVKSETSEFCRESETPYPNVSMGGLHYAIDGNNSGPVDCLMNTAVTSMDVGKSEVHMSFMPPRCETSTSYPIKAHGAEAKNSRMSRFQMTENFSSTECCTSLLPLVDNFGATGNKNDVNIVPLSFSSQTKVDRNFLSLGIGSGMDIRPNSNFSALEIASKLGEVSSHRDNSIVRHCPKNPLNLTHSMGRAEGIISSAGGLSSSACLASRMPTRHEGGLIRDTRLRLDSIPSPDLQIPQANAQSNFPQASAHSSFGSTLISQPKHGTQPEITSKYFSSQPISRQQDNCSKSSMEVSSECSRNFLSHRHNQSSISHVQLGRLLPLTGGATQSNADVNYPKSVQAARNLTLTAEGTRTAAAAKIGSFASSFHPVGRLLPSPGGATQSNADVHFPKSVQAARPLNTHHNIITVEALGNTLSPKRDGLRIPKSGTSQSAAAGLFPKRLGLQPNDFATARAARGLPPIHLASQFNPIRPSATAGHVIPVANFDVRPQAPPIVSHPSLKRKANENPATARSGQQRKILPRPVVNYSAPVQRQSIPAISSPIPATVHIPPAPLHIKWPGFDEPLEPTGEKCRLCKRDLSFTAEGLVFQPATPPAVALLPCGHTFHDHCLQIITPQGQSTSPPCIPCAIGET